MIRGISLFFLLGAMLSVAPPANADSPMNGDFETGDLTGWTTFVTENGTLGTGFPNVVLFDTNNDGFTSLAAQFRVGQEVFEGCCSITRGGGIFQNVLLGEGSLTITVDIAAHGSECCTNFFGGLVELLLDGAVVDSHDFGIIEQGANEHSMLSHIGAVANGAHEVRIRMTRPGIQADTPIQYIDNVMLSGSAVGGFVKRRRGQLISE